MAEGMAEMGANVVLCARKQERCQQAAQELGRLNVNAMAIACDVKSQTSVQEMVQAAQPSSDESTFCLTTPGYRGGQQ